MDVDIHLGHKPGDALLQVDGVDLTHHVLRDGFAITYGPQGPQIQMTLAPGKDVEVSVEVQSILDLIDGHLQTAYERGWRDACDDHLDQQHDPTYPIGGRYQQPYDHTLPQVPRIMDGGGR